MRVLRRWGTSRLVVVCVALVLIATACGNDDGGVETTLAPANSGATGPVRGGILELLALNDLATLDNSQAVSSIDYNLVAGALFEGLYQFNNAGELEARLADGMPQVSADGLVYTFKLREGAMFAGPDFEPRQVTADDVAYGLLRALDPNTLPAPSWGGGYLFPIQGAPAFANGEIDSVEGIEVLDDQTLRITLSEPTTTFVFGLTIATSWPLPREAVEERGEGFADRPVGAGPFFVQEWNKGKDITVVRNPGYVDPDLPYVDALHIDLGVDENTQVLRLETGEADASFEQFNLTPPAIRQLRGNPNITIQPTVGPRIFYLALNNWGMFENKDLRLAVAHAATRDFVAQFGEMAVPWNQLMSSTSVQSDPDGTRIYPFDADKAREYIASAGYDGTPVRVIYDVTDPYASSNSTALKQDLEAVGFTVDLQGMQSTEFFGALGDVDYDISSTYWSADYPDAQDFISTNFVCFQVDPPWGLNISRFCDENIDAAFVATERMAFGPERDAALLEVQQALIDEVAGLPIMEVNPPVVWGPGVGEIVSLATYAPFDWKRAWLKAGGG
ncbi:MAG: ABC transporter substrate-binding protein [Acidimicrobiia bacterium]|nr:ABC transporter substrate-binding protein [Acidimicrobiia bacterium]